MKSYSIITLKALACTIAGTLAASAQNTFPNSGPVGIGTTSPQSTLHVNGDLLLGADPSSREIRSTGILDITSTDQLYINRRQGSGNVFVGGGGGKSANMILSGNLSVAGDLDLGDAGRSTRGIKSTGPMDITSGSDQPLYLNRHSGSGDVHVGRNMVVVGKATVETLELTSDRNQKRDIVPVSGQAVLRKLLEIPISTWAYTNSPSQLRIGAMAQDFKRGYGLGGDDKHINAGDGIGVAFAAIQGLHEIVQEKDAEIKALKSQIASMQREVSSLNDNLNGRLAALEQSMQKENVQRVGFRPETAAR